MSWKDKTFQEKVEETKKNYEIDVDASLVKKISFGHESLRNRIAEEKSEDPVDKSKAKHFEDFSVSKSLNGHYVKFEL